MVEPWVILLILPMIVYFTRIIGVVISRFVSNDSRYKSTLVMLPICAMISFFIPAALKGNPYEIAVLAGFSVLFWVTNNSLLSIVAGVLGLLAVKFYL